MKVCPQCNASYEDSMFFCLEDGNPLRSTDVSVQTNPATFENTLIMATDEKTLDLPIHEDLTAEKTLTLPSEAVTQQQSVQTEIRRSETLPPQPLPVAKTNETIPLSSYQDTDDRGRKGKFIVVGGLFGLIALFGAALGGWWLLPRNSDVVAIANTNKLPQNSNNNLGFSNSIISNVFGETNSIGSNIESNTNANKLTPKPSPSATKDKKDSPTPTPNQTPETISTPQPTPTPKVTPTPAQTPQTTRPPKIVSGGVLNGKATNLVRPPYPPAARAIRASGAVSVQVLIDEEGNVVRASAVSGHALLRAAAEQAARSSKFNPTILGGQPVKVTGVIVYNFSTQ